MWDPRWERRGQPWRLSGGVSLKGYCVAGYNQRRRDEKQSEGTGRCAKKSSKEVCMIIKREELAEVAFYSGT